MGIEEIQGILACPACFNHPKLDGQSIVCSHCGRNYPILSGIADFRITTGEKKELEDWSDHWAEDKQSSLAQRFFSVYRKQVFSRTVGYYLNRFFPEQGLFIEAGSGTSETSGRINKNNGRRKLIALDIVLEVLRADDIIMDIGICGDIFRLPFLDNTIDGIWNVGVMEHFYHPQIDQIMREFNRVLKPNAPLLVLWPATYSIPQRMLRITEWMINLKGGPKQGKRKYRFHPDEVSQLKSTQEGRAVFLRNEFNVLSIDAGLRSLMAFITIVGIKHNPNRETAS